MNPEFIPDEYNVRFLRSCEIDVEFDYVSSFTRKMDQGDILFSMYVKQEGDFYCCTPNGYEDGPTSRYYLRVEDEGIIYEILDQYEKV